MKKTLIVLGIFLLVIGLGIGGFLIVRGKKGKEEVPLPSPKVFIETTLEERPFISLTPSIDGHWLTLKVSRIREADSLEYELTYNTKDGVNQGAMGGPFELSGKTAYEKKILLGTESSGHYSYHRGVEKGSLMVRLEGGKGPRKFVSDFYLQKGVEKLRSIDGKFSLAAVFPRSQFYLTMPTVGLPGEIEEEVKSEPYGVFSSGRSSIKNGQATIEGGNRLQFWNGQKWQELTSGAVNEIGVFISS